MLQNFATPKRSPDKRKWLCSRSQVKASKVELRARDIKQGHPSAVKASAVKIEARYTKQTRKAPLLNNGREQPTTEHTQMEASSLDDDDMAGAGVIRRRSSSSWKNSVRITFEDYQEPVDEKRIAKDCVAYTYRDFLKHYGPRNVKAAWDAASDSDEFDYSYIGFDDLNMDAIFCGSRRHGRLLWPSYDVVELLGNVLDGCSQVKAPLAPLAPPAPPPAPPAPARLGKDQNILQFSASDQKLAATSALCHPSNLNSMSFILDGLNIMRSRNAVNWNYSEAPQLEWTQLEEACRYYASRGKKVSVYLPSLCPGHEERIERCRNEFGDIFTICRSVSDDLIMINTVKLYGGRIVTNDRFEDWKRRGHVDAAWIERHCVRFAFGLGGFIPSVL